MEHECYGITHRGHNNVTSMFIAGKIREKLALQPDYKPVDIVKDMKADFGVEVTYYKAWAAKERAMVQINGTHEGSYAQLPKYIEKLKEANPGSESPRNYDREQIPTRFCVLCGKCKRLCAL